MLREVGFFSEKKVDLLTENIEEGDSVSPVQVITTPSTGNRRPLKRTYALAGQHQCPKHQEKTDQHPLDLTDYIPRPTKWTKIVKLDRVRKLGLSEKDFHGLFAKCKNCGRITTRKVFRHHLEDCEGCEHEGDTDTESEQEV